MKCERHGIEGCFSCLGRLRRENLTKSAKQTKVPQPVRFDDGSPVEMYEYLETYDKEAKP